MLVDISASDRCEGKYTHLNTELICTICRFDDGKLSVSMADGTILSFKPGDPDDLLRRLRAP